MIALADVNYFEPWWVQIVKSLAIFAVIFGILPMLIVYERKLLGRFQGRYGPNRVGPFGLMQPLAEIVKFAMKEPFRTTTSVAYLFRLAPVISIITAVGALAIIPWGDVQHIFGQKVGLYGIDVSIGPLYVFALAGISFYGIMLGGWASGSKYSFLGSMRGAAQLISYEVSQGLSIVGVLITAQTLSLTGIVHAQAGMWFFIPQFAGFLVFLVASFAETNRAPFDLIEADAELVAGYFTEYGGTPFVAFLFAEYDASEDVIDGLPSPSPGAVAGAYRVFGETPRGLKTTFARIVEGPVTIQYPEEKTPVYPRFRGRHKLHRFEDTGLEKCVGCSLCAAACPADCIRVVAAENTPENRISAGERYAAVYEINMSRCIFCGYCEVACPFDAITMGHDYEISDYNRGDLVFTKEMLLAESLERSPLRREGEWHGERRAVLDCRDRRHRGGVRRQYAG